MVFIFDDYRRDKIGKTSLDDKLLLLNLTESLGHEVISYFLFSGICLENFWGATARSMNGINQNIRWMHT
jgi:hypothetical protein